MCMEKQEKIALNDHLETLISNNVHLSPIVDDFYSAIKYREQINSISVLNSQTALAFGMHLYTLWAMCLRHSKIIKRYHNDFVNDGALMCSLNDPGVYFKNVESLDYDKFPIRAVKVSGGFEVTGIKPFSSMADYISFIPLTAITRNQSGKLELITLFLKRHQKKVSILNNWNSISMSDTATNSIKIDGVRVDNEDVMYQEYEDAEVTRNGILDLDLFLYRFHICVTYESIGIKALKIILNEFNDVDCPVGRIRNYPHPQYQLASILLKNTQNKSVMDDLTAKVDNYISGKISYQEMDSATLIAKELVTSTSELMVNEALQIAGIRGLSKVHPLSSLYLDVKAGRFHPPQQASAYELIAKKALRIDPQEEVRWI